MTSGYFCNRRKVISVKNVKLRRHPELPEQTTETGEYLVFCINFNTNYIKACFHCCNKKIKQTSLKYLKINSSFSLFKVMPENAEIGRCLPK